MAAVALRIGGRSRSSAPARPRFKRCGTKFTDQRWTESEKKDWGEPVESHPKLCGDCKMEALEAERVRKAAMKEADRKHCEAIKAAHAAAEAEAARKANRILRRSAVSCPRSVCMCV